MRSKKHILIFIAAALTGTAAMNSCTHDPQTVVTPAVSFSADILPIFRASCAINSSCHVGSYNLNDHTDLTDSLAYNTIIKNGLINTANPTASLLYNQVSTGVMPQPPNSPLSAAQVALILDWIKDGGKND